MIYDVEASTLFNTLKSAFNEREIVSITDNQNFVPIILGNTTKSINAVLSNLNTDTNFNN